MRKLLLIRYQTHVEGDVLMACSSLVSLCLRWHAAFLDTPLLTIVLKCISCCCDPPLFLPYYYLPNHDGYQLNNSRHRRIHFGRYSRRRLREPTVERLLTDGGVSVTCSLPCKLNTAINDLHTPSNGVLSRRQHELIIFFVLLQL